MAHYAFLDNNNEVIEVITGIDEDDTSTLPSGFADWEAFYLSMRPNATKCKRTSYNTFQNAHILGGTAFRGNYAGVGYIYDQDDDVFYPPQPFASWTKDTTNIKWVAPINCPGNEELYYWDEEAYQADNTTGWVEL